MGMEYDEAAAERLEAVYLGPDVVRQREDTLRRISVQSGGPLQWGRIRPVVIWQEMYTFLM